jgi:hypothetical protein
MKIDHGVVATLRMKELKTICAKAVASAASKALPPALNICAPTSAARG